MENHKKQELLLPNFSYRKITNEDLDLLYQCPEAKEALEPIRGDRFLAEDLVELEWSVAVNNATNELLFCLGQLWSYSEITPRYLYFYENKMCTFIEVPNELRTISIFYCSEFLDISYMKKYFNFVLKHSNEFLITFEKSGILKFEFDFIVSKDLFRHFV